jgi:hypothetical protein
LRIANCKFSEDFLINLQFAMTNWQFALGRFLAFRQRAIPSLCRARSARLLSLFAAGTTLPSSGACGGDHVKQLALLTAAFLLCCTAAAIVGIQAKRREAAAREEVVLELRRVAGELERLARERRAR